MTTEITPELLRAVADEASKLHLADGSNTEITLRAWATNLEREQANEQRIDTLVKVFFRAAETTPGEYDVRAGVRALIAKHDDECEPPFDKGGEFHYHLPANPDVVHGGSNSPDPVLQIGWGDPGADPAEDWDQQDEPDEKPYCAKMRHHPTRPYMCTLTKGHNGQHAVVIDGSVHATWDDHVEPLQWHSLLDVPTYIRRVTDANGLLLYRNVSDDHWELSIPDDEDNSDRTIVTAGPYTEIRGGDQ